MATTNQIRVNSFSYTDVSNNFWAITIDALTQPTNIPKNSLVTDRLGNQGIITYNSISDATFTNIWITDSSGILVASTILRDSNINISGIDYDLTIGPASPLNTNRRYNGMNYTIFDAVGSQQTYDLSGNFIYYPQDDAGGPSSLPEDPGFISINTSCNIVSNWNGTGTSAQVRYTASDTESGTTFEDGTLAISGQSNSLYPDNPNGGIWIGVDAEPSSGDSDYIYIFFASSSCYHSQTILETENGPICIKDIKRGMLIKTRNGFKKVVSVLSNGCKLKDFVVFEKGSLGPNVPNKKLMITKGHPVYYRGKYLNSLEFVKNNFFDKIYIKRLETEGLHHIQFETHECILTNNLWTTSLPHNMGNKVPEDLYFDKSLFNPNDKGNHYPPYCLHKDPPTDQLDDDDLEEIFNYN